MLQGLLQFADSKTQTVIIVNSSGKYQGFFRNIPEDLLKRVGQPGYFKGVALSDWEWAISEYSFCYPLFRPVGWHDRHTILISIYV